MDRELSAAVFICVALISLSIVIGIIWYTVYQGRQVGDRAFEKGNNMANTVSIGELEDIVGSYNEMSVASAFVLVKSYMQYIPKCKCNVCGNLYDANSSSTMNAITCMLNHMHGRVSLEIDKINGWYEIIVHKEGCNWYYDTCTCESIY